MTFTNLEEKGIIYWSNVKFMFFNKQYAELHFLGRGPFNN